MSKDRPFGVTLLAIFAGIAAVLAIYHTLQMLGLFSFSGPLGVFKFYTFDWLGAIMWGILALIYIWLVRMLWNVDPSAWWFMVILTILNLFFALIALIGGSSFESMAINVFFNAIVLLYCALPGTREAFAVDDVPA
jgi:hypothetical protein